MNAKTIGKKLKELRGEKSRRMVSNETGISYSGLANYETGFRIPTDPHKIILARYYDVPIEALFFAEDNHPE